MLIFQAPNSVLQLDRKEKNSRFNWTESLHRQESWIKRKANLVTKYLETTVFAKEGLKLVNFLIFRCFEKIHDD